MEKSQNIFEITDPETGQIFTIKPESLVSHVRDVLLQFRQRQVEATLWNKLSEQEQQGHIDEMQNLAFDLVSTIVEIVAQGDRPVIHAILDNFAIKDGIVKIVAKGTADDDALVSLNHVGKKGLKIIVADADQFDVIHHERTAAPDEPSMFVDDDDETLKPFVADDVIDPALVHDEGHSVTIAMDKDGEFTPVEQVTKSDAKKGKKQDKKPKKEHKAKTDNTAENEKQTAENETVTEAAPVEVDQAADDEHDKNQNVSEEIFYVEGVDAAEEYIPQIKNPYENGTLAFTQWNKGWDGRQDEMESLFKDGEQARIDGISSARCPWKPKSPAHKHWMVGYEHARAKEA